MPFAKEYLLSKCKSPTDGCPFKVSHLYSQSDFPILHSSWMTCCDKSICSEVKEMLRKSSLKYKFLAQAIITDPTHGGQGRPPLPRPRPSLPSSVAQRGNQKRPLRAGGGALSHGGWERRAAAGDALLPPEGLLCSFLLLCAAG